ncbi:MAG: cadherin domain-containing protein [Alphaproteobacteria bacterium]|nr:cadherin domain-containing protein [Alphaproteobacteria bacterium]
MRPFLALPVVLAGCLTRPSPQAPPPPPVVQLTPNAGALVRGAPILFEIEGVPAGSTVYLLASRAPEPASSCPAQIAPTCLDIGAPVVVGSTSVAADLPFGMGALVPATLPGTSAEFQLVVRLGGAVFLSPSVRLPIRDAAPGAVVVTPDPAFTTDDLVASYTGSGTVSWQWTVDGAPSAVAGDTVPSSATTKGQRWVAGADIDDAGTARWTQRTVFIRNSPPSLTGAHVTPADPDSRTTLSCVADGWSDADGDPQDVTYTWTVDGASAGTGPTLSPFAFWRDALVTCTATPNDGEDLGTARTSAPVLIGNAAPVVEASVVPDPITTCAPLVCSARWEDPDPDGFTVRYTWTLNGQPVDGQTGRTWSAGESLDDGDAVQCSAFVDDGTVEVGTLSAAATVVDLPPTLSSVRVPDHAIAGDVVTCEALGFDDECASSQVAYSWNRNGQPLGVTGPTLDTSMLAANGGDVTCVATPSDATQTGSPVTSNVLAVEAAGFDVTGENAGDHAGWSVALAHDANGDGLRELVVGAPSYSFFATHRGRVYVVDGQTSGSVPLGAVAQGNLVGYAIDGEEGDFDLVGLMCGQWTPCGESQDPVTGANALDANLNGPSGDALGYAVSAGGDMDGDGVGDFLFAAPFARGADNRPWGGHVYLVSGASAEGRHLGDLRNGHGGVVLVGERGGNRDVENDDDGDLAGWSASFVGDHDGDGLWDAGIGALNYGPDQGRAWIVYGSPERGSLRLQADIATQLVPGRGYAVRPEPLAFNFFINFSRTVLPAGDVDGDGRMDTLFGGEFLAGRVIGTLGLGARRTGDLVVNQTITPDLRPLHLTDDPDGVGINFGGTGPRIITHGDWAFGLGLGGNGDVNGDGVPDTAAGVLREGTNQPTALVIGFNARGDTGVPMDHDGADADRTILVTGVTLGSGRPSVTMLPDMDGDGLDEVAFTDAHLSPTNDVYVLWGRSAAGIVDVAQLQDGTAGFVRTGDGLGSSIVGGDLNGDGLGDLILGEYRADDEAGAVHVTFGRDYHGYVSWRGGPDADVWTGSPDDETAVGGRGDDDLDGQGGADVIYAGSGDDVITVGDAGFRRVDGGLGFDTLRFADPTFDFASLAPFVRSIEVLELTGGAQEVILANHHVLNLDPELNELWIRGGGEDIVRQLEGSWVNGGEVVADADTYTLFQDGRAELYVQTGVQTRFNPAFTSDVVQIEENTLPGTVVGPLPAADADGTVVAWQILDGDPDGLFDIDGSGNLVVAAPVPLDFETGGPTYELTIQITDDDGLTATGQISIEILDVNEPPEIVTPLPVFFVEEGSFPGTTVGSLTAMDVDAGDTQTWRIVSQVPAGAFAIDPTTGRLDIAVGGWVDHEMNPSHTVTVEVADAGGLTDQATFAVDIGDLSTLEQQFTLSFSTSGRSLWGAGSSYVFYVPDAVTGLSFTDDGASSLQELLYPYNFPPLPPVDLPFDVLFDMQGELLLYSDLVFDSGHVDVDVPVQVDLQMPDELTPGTPFELVSEATVLSGANMAGDSMSWTLDFDVEAIGAGVAFGTCLNGSCTEHFNRVWNYPRSNLYDNNFEPVSYSSTSFVESSFPVDLQATIHTTPIIDRTQGWDSYTEILLQRLGVPANLGQLTYASNGFDVDLDYILWTIEYYGGLDFQQDLGLDLQGVVGTITWEGDVAGPSFVVGTPTSVTPPANADLDGDGKVDMSISFALMSELTNRSRFTLTIGKSVQGGKLRFRIRDDDNVGPWVGTDDFVFQASADYVQPVDDTTTFDVGGFNEPIVIGAIDLAEAP